MVTIKQVDGYVSISDIKKYLRCELHDVEYDILYHSTKGNSVMMNYYKGVKSALQNLWIDCGLPSHQEKISGYIVDVPTLDEK